MRKAGLSPNRLTNAWVPFVVAASLALKPDGRLAMVLPAELLQVNYAAELRAFLSDFFKQITVLTFRRLVFDGIQQEVVLLLAERAAGHTNGIEVLEMNETSELRKYDPLAFGVNGFKSVDHDTEKWTKYYLSQNEIDLLRELRRDRRLTMLGEIASVDVGIVTGMNEVFVLNESRVKGQMRKFTRPLVGRSGHLKGTTFTTKDWEANAVGDLPAYLLDIPPIPRKQLPRDVEHHINDAEERKLNAGYKCRIRKVWYAVPSVYVADGFLLRQIHSHPKLVLNEAGATCTDTIHRVTFSKKIDQQRVAGAFLNSLTFAFSEILGRSYGGGVLELEPNEADRIPIPLRNSEKIDFDEIDRLVRDSKIDEVLSKNDQILLSRGLGMSREQCQLLRGVWEKLRDRRTGRRTVKHSTQYEVASLHTLPGRQSEHAVKTSQCAI
jgi:adenine-specific DNA-methyltransferase